MEIVHLFYFSVEESLSSSTVVGSLSHYLSSVLIFSITAIDANSNNFSKSTDSLSTVIGLPFHGRQNFRKLGYEIPAPRSPLPAHVLAFPPRTGANPVTLQILVIPDNLHECPNEIIDSSNIQITTSVARLLIPFVVHRFGEIT
jgi:hypothetical protein